MRRAEPPGARGDLRTSTVTRTLDESMKDLNRASRTVGQSAEERVRSPIDDRSTIGPRDGRFAQAEHAVPLARPKQSR